MRHARQQAFPMGQMLRGKHLTQRARRPRRAQGCQRHQATAVRARERPSARHTTINPAVYAPVPAVFPRCDKQAAPVLVDRGREQFHVRAIAISRQFFADRERRMPSSNFLSLVAGTVELPPSSRLARQFSSATRLISPAAQRLQYAERATQKKTERNITHCIYLFSYKWNNYQWKNR